MGFKNEWEDEHETAEEFEYQMCNTILKTEEKKVNVVITMKTISCVDTSVRDEFNEFLLGCKTWVASSGEMPSFHFIQSTSVLPQYFGVFLVIISLLLAVAYYYNVPFLLLHKLS